MWIKKLRIKNFRQIENLEIQFNKGLSVLVGENNCGKTTIIDALRMVLFPGRDYDSINITEDDFRRDSENSTIEISALFSGLSSQDQTRYLDCLVLREDHEFDLRFNIEIEFDSRTGRCKYRTSGGEVGGSKPSSDHHDFIHTIYLPPLRDPNRELRPGHYSRVSKILQSNTSVSDQSEFESIAKEANEKIQSLDAIKDATTSINEQSASIAGPVLSQETELVFSDPEFSHIVAGLKPVVDDLPFHLNGLGFNNLLMASASLVLLKKSPDLSYRGLLVEEPEAHLHPHLQVLLLRQLANIAAEGDKKKQPVQVVVSSHSPLLVSQAPLQSIISISQGPGSIMKASEMAAVSLSDTEQKKLKRYLDSTRSELFFAKKVILVEGISDHLIIQSLSRHLQVDLKSEAVTIVRVEGLNFDIFVKLFQDEKLPTPVSIVTDGDMDSDGKLSSSSINLRKMCQDIPNVEVFYCEKTLEHELAKTPALLKLMLSAYSTLHPVKGLKLSELILPLLPENGDHNANVFLDYFKSGNTSKGRYAQELAQLIDDCDIDDSLVPEYIANAVKTVTTLEPFPGGNNE